MIQRLALLLVLAGLGLVLAVVALMLTDGLSPGRVAPGFAALGAALGGGLIVGGLFALEHGQAQRAAPGRRAERDAGAIGGFRRARMR